MKKNLLLIITFATVLGATGCRKQFYDEDVIVDPNGASVESVLTNATDGEINQLAVGVQSTLRSGITSYYRESGTIGREIIYSASTEPRYYTELLGTTAGQYNGTNDPAGIFNGYYTSYSSLRRRAEILLRSAENTTALTTQEKAATKGFAKTMQAYAVWVLVNMQGKNGVRETFSDLLSPGDLLKPGRFGTYESGLTLAKTLINEGLTELNAGGTDFPFTMTTGWSGFSNVANFKKVNRAIAARIALYQKDWDGVLTALNESFFALASPLQTGPVMTFSTTTNDQTNGLFHVSNSTGAPFVVFNEFVTQAETGDTRVFGANAKVGERFELDANGIPTSTKNPRTSGGVTSTHEVRKYASNTSSISIIRNEELILMYAEAKAQLGQFADAVIALDRIRSEYGLQGLALAKPTILANKDGLIDEVLNQRRYSLFFEGQRWFDMRRYNRLSQLPFQGTINNVTYIAFENLARPDAEVQWDRLNP